MDAQNLEETTYGNIKVNDGQDCVEAYDDWGNVCHDALMLAIPVAKKVKMSIQKWQNKNLTDQQ